MEKPPYEFKAITSFSKVKVEKAHPKIDCIKKLTLEIGSSIPNGRFSLVLIEPFPPLGRAGENLSKLMSLQADDIEYIQAFRKTDGKISARMEIHRKNSDKIVVVKCKRIEGVPGWDGKHSQCRE